MTEEDILRRLPLWCALADLFLDTEMQPSNYEAVARAAREGGFAAAEVRDILENEMWPAFSFNLLDIAGEWAGFSSDYVRTRLLETLAGANSWPVGDNAFRDRFMHEEWSIIEAALEGCPLRVLDRGATTSEAKRPRRSCHILLMVVCLAMVVIGLGLALR